MPTKILIGSVLKPVDDVRHYHKIAKSLVVKDTEFHIFGYHSGAKPELENITFHPAKPFKRISLGRIISYIRFLFLGLKIKPDIIICCTHELLKTSVQLRILTGAKIIYDVQENYYSNIIHTDAFPKIFRYPIAWVVRLNEIVSSWFVSHFLLAEKCYLDELTFVNEKNSTIIENKLKIEGFQTSNFKLQTSNFLITGTLGLHYGTKEGVEFFKNINKIKPETTLEIIGVCRENSLKTEIEKLKLEIVNIDTKPIPYAEIIKALKKGGIALLPYQPNKSTKNRIPTKFYEYLYYKIPMIVQKNNIWEEFLTPYKAAIFIDFNNYKIDEVNSQIENYEFYSRKEVGNEILWDSEEEKLLKIDLWTK